MADMNIAVLGCGVIGIVTALELKKRYRNAKITVIAEKFNNDTTSYVAAGIFRPSTSFGAGLREHITRKWVDDSFHYWEELRNTVEASNAGVIQLSGYIFSSEHPGIVRNHYLEHLLPVYRKATEEELKLCPGNWKFGSFFTTILTSCDQYLPWATKQFLDLGGNIVNEKINRFEDISSSYNIIVNCTGLGAKYLCNDLKVVPIRGQVLKVRAPWIKMFFYGDFDTYIIPGFNAVTLGGCRQYESYDLQINKYDGLSIKERCENLVPSLRGAQLIEQRVGLRPHRDPVRVEKEIKTTTGGKKMKIVHNYGHGGYGVTTAPGTSKYACELVQEFLAGNSKL